MAQTEPGAGDGRPGHTRLLDEEVLRDALPPVVLALATWCGDLTTAERLTTDALDRVGTLSPLERPPGLLADVDDVVAWCLGRARPGGPGEQRQPGVEVDADGTPSGLDERLALLFVVCDPLLAPDDQLVLALRLVAGLSVDRAALHLGLGDAATRTRLTRALETLDAAHDRFEVPDALEREQRLPQVLDCVAAMFTVAHRTSPEPPDALEDLGPQALSIADGLVDVHPGDSEVRGLRAVVLLGLARRPGRVDDAGVALTLDQVDRTRWDHRMLAVGLGDTAFAMQGHGRFALEAAIAAEHTTAAGAADTDWSRIVQLYAVLRQVWASPAVEVAELAARTQHVLHQFPGTEVEAAQVLLVVERRLVELLGDAPTFARRDAAFALADLRWRTGRRAEAAATYARLLEHVTSPPIRAFCERRIAHARAD